MRSAITSGNARPQKMLSGARIGAIHSVVFGGLENHSRRWFPALGGLSWRVGTEIGGIDQTVAELARYLGFNGAILFFADPRSRVGIDAKHHEHWVAWDRANQKKHRQAHQNKDGDEL